MQTTWRNINTHKKTYVDLGLEKIGQFLIYRHMGIMLWELQLQFLGAPWERQQISMDLKPCVSPNRYFSAM